MPPVRFLFAFPLLLVGCASEPDLPALDTVALQEQWDTWAARRDSLFRSPDTPFLPEDQAAYDGVPYYPYDTTLAVPALLVPSLRRDTVSFPTTTGELQRYIEAGHLVFSVRDVEWRLEAFESIEGPRPTLFVPFRDATSGSETYGGGRYLDLDLVPTGRYALDFNRAYNPFCVYNPTYSCPLPPPENTLEVAIEAGERMP